MRRHRCMVAMVTAAMFVAASTGCSGRDPVPPRAAPSSAAPAPVEATPAEPEDTSTRFGAAPEGGQDLAGYSEALALADATLGRLEVVRVFYKGMPDPWPGKAPGRDVVVSFKIHPEEVLSGAVDESMRRWFRSAPRDLGVNWVYYHEPEDNIEDGDFAAADFRAAFAHLSDLAGEADNPRLRATLVLQSYTLKPVSGREWRDYYPGDDAVDVFAWDVYNRPSASVPYASPEQLLDGPRIVSESTGHPFAVAELGSVLAEGDDGRGRADWLRAMGAYFKEHQVDFVSYFDLDFAKNQDDYRLRDDASLRAWRSLSQG